MEVLAGPDIAGCLLCVLCVEISGAGGRRERRWRYGYGRWEGVKIVEDRLYVLEVVRNKPIFIHNFLTEDFDPCFCRLQMEPKSDHIPINHLHQSPPTISSFAPIPSLA